MEHRIFVIFCVKLGNNPTEAREVLRSSEMLRNIDLWLVTEIWAPSLKVGVIGCPVTLVTSYQSALHDIPKERSHLCRDRSLKSGT